MNLNLLKSFSARKSDVKSGSVSSQDPSQTILMSSLLLRARRLAGESSDLSEGGGVSQGCLTQLNAFPPEKSRRKKGTTVCLVPYTHPRAHETVLYLVCRLLLEKKNLILSLTHLTDSKLPTTLTLLHTTALVHTT